MPFLRNLKKKFDERRDRRRGAGVDAFHEVDDETSSTPASSATSAVVAPPLPPPKPRDEAEEVGSEWAVTYARDHERFYDSVGGQVIDYVTNREAFALAALVYESDEPDIVWIVQLSFALFFDWEGWREAQPRPTPHFYRPTAAVVEKALGQLSPVEVLSLDGRQLNDAGFAWLSEALVLRHNLNVVDLSFNKMTIAGLRTLIGALKYSSVEGLYLGSNSLGDEGAMLVAEQLIAAPTSNIQRLNLSSNGISGRGALAVIDAIIAGGGKTVQLSLTNNELITRADCDEMNRRLSAAGVTMQHLDVRGCSLSTTGEAPRRHGGWASIDDTGTATFSPSLP